MRKIDWDYSHMNSSSRRGRSLTLENRLVFGAVINFFVLSLLIPIAWLREQPAFWTDAGGWPIWLREFIEASFYPLFLLELLLLAIVSSVCAQLLPKQSANGKAAVSVLLLLWMLFLFAIVIVAANNLDNLIAGRSLHWHTD